MKAWMNINFLRKNKILVTVFILFLFGGCGVNDDQNNFENEALTPPNGITEMTATGQPVDGEEPDESDWQIAPEFSGLVNVSTAPYPNPAQFNGTVFIELYVSGIQAVNGLKIYVYRPNTNALAGPFYIENKTLNPGLTIVTLSAADIARTGTTATNLYRIVIYDGSQNIITYGDIKIK